MTLPTRSDQPPEPRPERPDRSEVLRALVDRVMAEVATRHRQERPALRPEDVWPEPAVQRRRRRR